MKFRVAATSEVRTQLLSIQDRRIREQLFSRMQSLAEEPDKKGIKLSGDLAEYRAVRAVGQRYRIVFRVERDVVIVVVVAVGLRKEKSRDDIYELARRLVRLGLTGLEEEDD